jgi:hypothetical protein
VSICSNDYNLYDPARVGNSFPPGTKWVVVWYRWEEGTIGHRVDINWLINEIVVVNQQEILQQSSGESAHGIGNSVGEGLPAGDYEVQVQVQGRQVTKIPFQIRADKSSGVKKP